MSGLLDPQQCRKKLLSSVEAKEREVRFVVWQMLWTTYLCIYLLSIFYLSSISLSSIISIYLYLSYHIYHLSIIYIYLPIYLSIIYLSSIYLSIYLSSIIYLPSIYHLSNLSIQMGSVLSEFIILCRSNIRLKIE